MNIITVLNLCVCVYICSLRAQYTVDGIEINQLHGASSEAEVHKDMEFFFPQEQTLAVIKPNAMSHKGEERDRGKGG